MCEKQSFEIVSSGIRLVLEDKCGEITEETPLIGSESLLDSMKLVELCLYLEDKSNELGFEFDWTSESALSRTRSMFRTAGKLSEEFHRQSEK